MLRNGGFFLIRISERSVLLLFGVVSFLGRGCEYCDEVVLAGVTGRSCIDSDVLAVGLSDEALLARDLAVPRELLDTGRFLVAAKSTIDGFPANTTDTTRAISSWLLLRLGEVGSSQLES
jgi:hypothetical protein